ncbi:hypothetical protein GA0115254_117761 [Streptomyces sp. Ncost-T10-10d]|nr:hypothetical protein GA0115254_117761 [Streptomyces sp. Ncost-T10-10d]
MDLDAQDAVGLLQVEVRTESATGRDAVQEGIGDEFAHAEQHVVGTGIARPVDEGLAHELSYERHGPAFPAVERLAEVRELSWFVHAANVTQSHYR